MKKLCFICTLFIIVFIFVSCNENNPTAKLGKTTLANTSTPTPSCIPTSTNMPTPTNTPTPTSIVTVSSAALAEYKAVLLNEVEYANKIEYDDLNNKECYLKDFPYLDSEKIFTIVDMDCDGMPEVIVKEVYDDILLSELDGDGCRDVVLHYNDGLVYGYFFSAGVINNVKTDGTFTYCGGDGVGCSKISLFGADPYPEEIFLSFSDNFDGEYSIADEIVSQADFDSFTEEQKLKDDVVWYPLNESNIESQLIINP